MYVTLWRLATNGMLCVGLTWLWLTSPGAVLIALPVSAGLALLLAVTGRRTVTEPGGPPSTPGLATTVVHGVAVGFGALGLLLIDAVAGLALLSLAGLTSPGLVTRLTAATHTDPEPGHGHRAVDSPPPAPAVAPEVPGIPHLAEVREVLAGLDDAKLCRVWRRSFLVLPDEAPAGRLAVVELRAACLEEMLRRHPSEVEAWLSAGARAQSGPDRHFRGVGLTTG